MSDNKAVMQMALEALGLYLMAGHGNSTDFAKQSVAYDEAIESIATLGAAIAQPEQPAQVPLNKHEIHRVLDEAGIKSDGVSLDKEVEIARAIEAAHGIAQPKDKP